MAKIDIKAVEMLMETAMPMMMETMKTGFMLMLNAMQPEEVQDIVQEQYVSAGRVKAYKKFDDYPDNLTIKQAAEMLGVKYNDMYAISRSKNTPFSVWGKSKRMVYKADLLKYLDERRGGYMLDEHNEDENDE